MSSLDRTFLISQIETELIRVMSHQSTSSGWTFLKYISSLNGELLIFNEEKKSTMYFGSSILNTQMRISHSSLVYLYPLVAVSSLLAEADTLDTLDLALLDWGLVALRWVLLEHKPGVGGCVLR